MFKPKYLLAGLALCLLPGCSSILSGTSDTISFDTNPPGADCTLVRDGKVIGNVKTPGGLTVEKTKHDIHVTCKKAGYQDSTGVLSSEIQDETWGNIILGGGVGWLIDSASGADNDYAENITITLVPENGVAPAGDVTPPPPDSPAPQSNAAPPQSYWRTNNDEVQGYDGKGWRKMPAATPLVLVGQRANLGLFEYPSNNGSPARVWIADHPKAPWRRCAGRPARPIGAELTQSRGGGKSAREFPR